MAPSAGLSGHVKNNRLFSQLAAVFCRFYHL